MSEVQKLEDNGLLADVQEEEIVTAEAWNRAMNEIQRVVNANADILNTGKGLAVSCPVTESDWIANESCGYYYTLTKAEHGKSEGLPQLAFFNEANTAVTLYYQINTYNYDITIYSRLAVPITVIVR